MSDKCTGKRCQMQAGVIDPANCKAETCAYRSTEQEEALEDLLMARVMLWQLRNAMLRHKGFSDLDAEFYCRQEQKKCPRFRRLDCEIKDLETAIKAVEAQIRAIDQECDALPENNNHNTVCNCGNDRSH